MMTDLFSDLLFL